MTENTNPKRFNISR